MTIYMTSDLHVDHYVSKHVSIEKYINNYLKPAEVLCVAGDTSDDPNLFVEFYKTVSPCYKKIFVIFGNHDLTVGNETYFRNNSFRETEAKLKFLKTELSKLENVSILDGNVEEYGGVKFGGTMGFNDWTWAYNLDPEPNGNIAKFLCYWHRWFDYVNWDYMKNNHAKILNSEMSKIDYIVSQKPDIILTHFIPLFFGVEKKYANEMSTTFFYFNGEKYLNQLKDKSIWVAGHTHSPRTKDLLQDNGKAIYLKLNPVGYPGENPEYKTRMDEFFLTR